MATGLSQPNASAHLVRLKGCGLVVGRQEGRLVYYRLADDRLEEVSRAVEDVFAEVAADIFACRRQDRLGVPIGNDD